MLPEKIGVESNLVEFLQDRRTVRARYRLVRSFGQPEIPPETRVRVSITTRVFDYHEIERRKLVPDEPLAEGPAVKGHATSEPQLVDLKLPAMPLGTYSVAAKVRVLDEHPKAFDPSNCFLGVVTYGELRGIKLETVQAIYGSQFGNPLAEDEIRRRLRAGPILVADEDGRSFWAQEREGRLDLRPIIA